MSYEMNEKEEILEVVKQEGAALRLASEELKNDKEVVLEAVKQNGGALEFASSELKNDKEVVLEAVKQDGEALRYASDGLQNDKEFVLEAVEQNGEVLEYVSEELKNDKEVVLEAVKQDGSSLLCAREELRNEKEIVLEAVKQNGTVLEYANEELRNEKEVVMEAVKQTGFALEYASFELRNDKEVVLEAVRQYGKALECASSELQNDKEVVLEAVKQDGEALRYASDGLQNDKEVVLEAVKKDGRALGGASVELRDDKEVVLEAVKQNGEALLYVRSEMKNDKEIVLEAVKQNGKVLLYAGEELKNDKEVVLEAVKQDGRALRSASEELKNDKEFVLEAVKQGGRALGGVSVELRNDKEVVLEAVKQNGEALQYVSKALVAKAKRSGVVDMNSGLLVWLESEVQKGKEKERKAEKFDSVEKELKEKEEQWEEEKKELTDENRKMLDSVLDSVGKGFRIPQNKLKIHREGKLGRGGFGSVFKADWTNEQGDKKEVAVKVLGYGFQTGGEEVFKEFSRSLQFHDENVIRTFGFDDSRKNEIAIVMEKLDGNMHDYVRENILTIEEKWDIIVKMTKGVHYLHSMKPRPFLHRDIKGENFLFKLDEEGELCVKICDFGLAKATTGTETQVSAAGQGTKLWMAPESGRGLYSVKSDVYSLGISFWEILYEEYPYGGRDATHVFSDVSRKGLRPDLKMYEKENDEEDEDEGEEGSPEDGVLPKSLKELLESCWNADRKKRPSTQDLLLLFEDMEMELLSEYDDEHFPPLEIQKTKKEGTTIKIKERKVTDTSDEDLEKSVDEEVASKLDTIEDLKKEIKSLRMENKEIKSLRMENIRQEKEIKSLKKFLEKNRLLDKYLEDLEKN